jgi:DNA repair exonuclease SbcCD nuclease subunit
VRLLCTGDIHLGRRPSRLPADSVPDLKRFSTSAGWEAIVELAIAEAVDLVAISGDLVDLENRFYEALGPVETGIIRLIGAGIPIVAVAGNHDFNTVPAFADRYPKGFRLLGRNQRWERYTLRDAAGRSALHIDGWSFAREHVSEDPVSSYAPPRASDAPVLGLLHADLDSAEVRYAPVRLRDLQRAPADAWLLGHIHAPKLIDEPGLPPVLYPGSPFPLDPGESGKHGVWFLDIEPERPPRFSFRPIARHRYQPLAIDLTGIEQASEAAKRVTDAVRDLHDAALAEPDGATLEYLLVRVLLTGTVPVGLKVADEMDQVQTSYRLPRGSIEAIQDLTRPQVDLAALAGEKSPPGALARLLLSLHDHAERPALLDSAEQAAESLARHPHFSAVAGESLLDPAVALEHASWQLLDTLLAQRGHAS